MTLKEKIIHFWLGPVEAVRLEAFRICIGTAMLFYMGFRWFWADEWLTSAGFHISQPNYPYFDFEVPLLPEQLLPVFGVFFFGSILLLILGRCLKWSCWCSLIGLVYVSAADQLAFFSPNKILMAGLCVYGASTIGRSPHVLNGKEALRAAWPVRILQATIIIHLFMAGCTKISYGGEWLIKPYVLWTQAQGPYRTEFAALLLNRLPERGWILMQYSALLFELLAPILFIRKRLRWLGLFWGIGFQIMIALTMKHLIYFNLIIMSFFILFVDGRVLRAIQTKLARLKHIVCTT